MLIMTCLFFFSLSTSLPSKSEEEDILGMSPRGSEEDVEAVSSEYHSFFSLELDIINVFFKKTSERFLFTSNYQKVSS